MAPFILIILRQPKVVFVVYSPQQKLTKSLTVALEYFKYQIRESRFLMKSAIKWASITADEFLQANDVKLDSKPDV